MGSDVTTVAVIACLYGDEYEQFVDDWYDSLLALDRQPDEIVLRHGDRYWGEKYPQARLQNEAIEQVEAEWVWPLNVDDTALPYALNGIDMVASDVWLTGYIRDGEMYIPEAIPNHEYLALRTNPYPGMSAFRKGAFEWVGRYPVIAHEDWGLWRRLAAAGCSFEASGRAHSVYRNHPLQRSQTELLTSDPSVMLREVLCDA